MLNFSPGLAVFAAAGLVAAAAPALLHLLNRRRFKTVHWGPMQFLRQAVLRSRKMVQLRDVLLMIIRTCGLLLFGVALSRPFFEAGYGMMSGVSLVAGFFGLLLLAAAAAVRNLKIRLPALAAGLAGVVLGGTLFWGEYSGRSKRLAEGMATRQPVHVVLLMDNSLSMGYRRPEGTGLDAAKKRAKEFIDHLPGKSRVTVIPLCGGRGGIMLDPCNSIDDARDAIDDIRIVDSAAGVQRAATLAAEASRDRCPELEKRVILLSDMQRGNWPSEAASAWKPIPDLQIVDLGLPAQRDNAWVADVQLRDRIADKDTRAMINAVIRYEAQGPRSGPAPTRKVEVALKVNGVVVDSKPQDLVAGQSAHVTFYHRFDCDAKPNKPVYVPISISISPGDSLSADDSRHLIVPVVSALPVLFVDQLGENENPRDGIFGETINLRTILAPPPPEDAAADTVQHIDVRHMDMEKFALQGQAALEDVRLVVIAGVADPGPMVKPLRQYVEQGGQLLLAAGADFQPAAWNLSAWDDGAGILPLKLANDPAGKVIQEITDIKSALALNISSIPGEWFHLPGETDEYLRDFYKGALFFKTAVALEDSEAKLVEAETKRLEKKLEFLIASDRKRASWAEIERSRSLSAEEAAARSADVEQRNQIQPRWLSWSRHRVGDPLDRRPTEKLDLKKLAEELAGATKPAVLARYTDGKPFAIQRKVGLGRIVMLSSGVYGGSAGSWSSLTVGGGVVVTDQMMRGMIESTLPRRNETVGRDLVIPLDGGQRRDAFALRRDGEAAALGEMTPEVLEGDTYGVILRGVNDRGAYTVERVARGEETAGKEKFDCHVAYNGSESESDIAVLDETGLKDRMKGASYQWVGKDKDISVLGSKVVGEHLWQWLIWTVLALFLIERLIIAWPGLRGRAEEAQS